MDGPNAPLPPRKTLTLLEVTTNRLRVAPLLSPTGPLAKGPAGPLTSFLAVTATILVPATNLLDAANLRSPKLPITNNGQQRKALLTLSRRSLLDTYKLWLRLVMTTTCAPLHMLILCRQLNYLLTCNREVTPMRQRSTRVGPDKETAPLLMAKWLARVELQVAPLILTEGIQLGARNSALLRADEPHKASSMPAGLLATSATLPRPLRMEHLLKKTVDRLAVAEGPLVARIAVMGPFVPGVRPQRLVLQMAARKQRGTVPTTSK